MPSQGDAAGSGLSQRFRAAVAWYAPSALVILALVVLWQVAIDLLQVKEYILPTPWASLKTLREANYQWLPNFLATFYAVMGAFVLSAILGVALAELMAKTLEITFANAKPDKPVKAEDVHTNAYSSGIKPLK